LEGAEDFGTALGCRWGKCLVQNDVAGDEFLPLFEARTLPEGDHAPSGHGVLASPAWKKKPSRPMPDGVLAVVWTSKVALSQISGLRISTGRYCSVAASAWQVSKFGTLSGATPPCTGRVPMINGASCQPPVTAGPLRSALITTGRASGPAAVVPVAALDDAAAFDVAGRVVVRPCTAAKATTVANAPAPARSHRQPAWGRCLGLLLVIVQSGQPVLR
jgi:hypothetical protein